MNKVISLWARTCIPIHRGIKGKIDDITLWILLTNNYYWRVNVRLKQKCQLKSIRYHIKTLNKEDGKKHWLFFFNHTSDTKNLLWFVTVNFSSAEDSKWRTAFSWDSAAQPWIMQIISPCRAQLKRPKGKQSWKKYYVIDNYMNGINIRSVRSLRIHWEISIFSKVLANFYSLINKSRLPSRHCLPLQMGLGVGVLHQRPEGHLRSQQLYHPF